jgi:hypothetical protein
MTVYNAIKTCAAFFFPKNVGSGDDNFIKLLCQVNFSRCSNFKAFLICHCL